ncbi:MAG: hypothetical protein K0B85_09910 [Coriobacteriia bacterium]|nr:hypothetical protein [Coriobacteriia bacterium]
MSAGGTGRWDDDRLERDEGVLIRDDSTAAEGCDDETDRCAPDEIVEDPIEDRHVPGTPDDLPYDYGVEIPPPADQALDTIDHAGTHGGWGVGETGPADEGDEPQLGRPEERELWRRQKPLIEAAEREEQHYRGLAPEHAEAIHEALAEDAEEPLSEAPDGTSATGSASRPE